MDQKNLLATNFGFFATLYTFFLGFAVVTLWTQYNEADSTVTNEAYGTVIIYRLSELIPNSDSLRSALVNYVKTVIDDEWPMLMINASSEKTINAYSEVWKAAQAIKPDKIDDKLYHITLLNKLVELSRLRHQRLDDADGNLYTPIWVVIYLGLFFSIVGFYFMDLAHSSADLYFLVAMVAMILSNLFLLYELDSPFSGLLHIGSEKFQDVLGHLQAIGKETGN